MAELGISGTADTQSGANAGLSVWESTWLIMMASAKLQARDVQQIEHAFGQRGSDNQPTPPQLESLQRRKALVLGGIMTACASVEAFINETFLQAMDERWAHANIFDARATATITKKWRAKIEPKPTLAKFQLALKFMNRPRFLAQQDPYQSAALAMELRNAFVHYKPRWCTEVDQRRITHATLETDLRGRFVPDRLEASAAIVPYGCFGHGCLEWVVHSTGALIQDFQDRTK